MTDIFVSAVDFASGIVLNPPVSISQAVVGANRGADWSPDGKRIAYLSQRATGPAAMVARRAPADGLRA